MAGGEAELVHQLDRGVLVIHVVARPPPPGEGLQHGHHRDVQQQRQQQVQEQWASDGVEASDREEQPGQTMAGYLPTSITCKDGELCHYLTHLQRYQVTSVSSNGILLIHQLHKLFS